MIGDPTSKCLTSGDINYMRWEVIPLLDAAGKNEYVSVCVVSVVFKVVAASGGLYG